jgi:CubicO group peptidase (beta-lactamase class C family)
VGAEPGDAFLYSGGGYALLQLIVEEVSGEPFDGYMRRAVFEPLGMTGSGFVLSDAQHQRLAEFFDTNGNLANHYRFAALAPVSLYTSVADLALLLGAYVPGPQGEPTGRGVLRPETLDAMRRPHAYQYGAAIWGLGTILFASNNAGTFIIGHDGSNAPATNTAARVDPASGDGIVILETGNLRLATDIAGEWVYWRTGNIDTFTFMVDAQRVFPIMAGGWALIVVTALALVWRNVKR